MNRDFWKLLAGSTISNFGDGLAAVAIPWAATLATRDAVAIASVAVVTRVPWLLFSMIGGVIADRVDRRRLIVGLDLGRLVLFGLLAVWFAVAPIGSGTIPVLLVGGFLVGTLEAVRDNVAQAVLPTIVEADQLAKANGRLFGAEISMNSFVGPPVAGILIGKSVATPFALNALTFLFAAGFIWSLQGLRNGPAPSSARPIGMGVATAIREALAKLWAAPFLRTLAIYSGLINLALMMGSSVLVLYAQEVLSLDARSYGWLLTSTAVGAILGATTSARVSRALGEILTLRIAMAVILTQYVAMTFSSSTVLVWLVSVFGTWMIMTWNVLAVSVRQREVATDEFGRINGAYRFIGLGLAPIGLLLGGLVVEIGQAFFERTIALRIPYGLAVLAVLLVAWSATRQWSSLGASTDQNVVDSDMR